MNRFGLKLGWLLLTVASSLVLAMPFSAHPRALNVQEFDISSFSADYYLSRDAQKTAQLNVIETIKANFPSNDQNHGILRAIPKSYLGHTLSLKIDNVKNDQGSSWNYTTSTQNDNLVLKIGDTDRYVHGAQTYVITYSMRNVVNILGNQDEFYWDINGDQWAQAIGAVTARVHISTDLASSLQQKQACYVGSYGSMAQSCTINRESTAQAVVVNTAANQVSPYKTLTLVLAFNKDTFAPGPEIAHEQSIKKIRNIVFAAGIALPPIIAFGFMLNRWRRFGNDPKGRGVIVPEYSPPKGFDVLHSDFVFNQKMGQKAFSAAIIELATKRYINIYETKQKLALRRDTTDYELEQLKPTDDLTQSLQKVLAALFDGVAIGTRVKMSDFKTKAVSNYKKMKELEDFLAKDLFEKGYFVKNPKKIKSDYMSWAAGFFILSVLVIISASKLGAWSGGLGIGLFLSTMLLFTFSFIMPAKTELGVQTSDYLKGLKDYIKLAEADRIKYLQSAQGAERIADPSAFNPKTPAQKIKLFETLLPYAILFGLEKSWAKEFKDLYTQPPDWYSGNWTTFNAVYLASSLNSFSASTSASFSAPSASSGSGFSGGAGGGGGGGGGGGW